MPGIVTPSEAEKALEMGLKYVKFFPAEQSGGINYIKAISAPYSDLHFMPTGGVSEKNILDYLSFNKVFACGGSWFVSPELVNAERWEEITLLCKSVTKKINEWQAIYSKGKSN